MAKWVTFYEDVFGVQDLKIHQDRKTATEYFKSHYKSYFSNNIKLEIKLPMSYGYPNRRFYGMSKYMYEKTHGSVPEGR